LWNINSPPVFSQIALNALEKLHSVNRVLKPLEKHIVYPAAEGWPMVGDRDSLHMEALRFPEKLEVGMHAAQAENAVHMQVNL
jgi:hypothetical protein